MDLEHLVSSSRPFLGWLVNWYNDHPTLELADLLVQPGVGEADNVAVMAVDVTNGFCYEGSLSSPRVGRIVEPVARLFERAYALGVRHFVLPQDSHSADAVEFGSFAPHCVGGTAESQTVPELQNLPFSDLFTIVEKDSVSVAIGTGLEDWLEAHPQVATFLVAGDCTDFCTHQLALYLRLRANAFRLRDVRVILPMDGVDTFDVPLNAAAELGIMPHHGDLLHLIFLYNMAENGVEVVARAV
jgi:nicotinamidase-related amidase